MATVLHCDDLVVSYGEHIAADHVSFDVAEGEVFGLLGPNGAGKTSVIRALTTIVKPASGSAIVAGVPLTDQQQVRHRIGVLPESSGYPAAQTGAAYLRFFGQIFGLSRSESDRRAAHLLDQFGLGATSQRIATYSRGMRQRLGLCRALINDPSVLFLDEPTLGLDPAGKEGIIRELAETASQRGTAVVICTHLLDEVERVCDRVVILDRGRTLLEGTVDDVISSAGVAGTARLRVAPADVPRAAAVLTSIDEVDRADYDNARPGDIDIELTRTSTRPEAWALAAILEADIEILAFDRRRASLNDAFLALTDPAQSST